MKLDEAIYGFLGGRSFLATDRHLIQSIVEEVEASEFEFTKNYIADIGDQIHIHRTMIVARNPLSNFEHRGKSPYRNYQYFRPLSKFRKRET